ncbi:MAG TPA: Hpt domain-containing protein [Solimonas sp.]|nr:Hpt domain-containing protein [Solimonas sp.]
MNARLRANTANGLHWVRGEIEQSLSRVRALVEQHAENSNDALPLQQAFVELHQVRGTAGMIQCYGVAELAEEMKQGLGDLLHGRIRETEAAYSALLGATVLLTDYIESLAEGMDDCMLVLQPAINELRLSRGKSVLTEADLFTSQMRSLNLGLPLPDEDAPDAGIAQQQAQKYLSVYQTSLLHWLRNESDANTALARIGKIAELLAGCSVRPAVHQLWRVMAAAVEALLSHALEDSLDIKRLIGRTGAQIKTLSAEGEDAANAAAGDLSLQLLYFIGRSRGQGPRVTVLRKSFQLQQLLPGTAQLEELRRRIHGPNTTLLARVSEEIRNDFAKIKDVIDLAVRAGGIGVPDLQSTRQGLKKIADTLSILGLSTLQRVLINQTHLLESLATPAATPQLWMDLATSILRVEHSLEDALFHQLQQARSGMPVEEIPDRVPHSRDLAEGIDALQRESLVNIAKLKSHVDGYIRGQDNAAMLVDAAKMMDEIASGFRILQDERAAGLAVHMAASLRSPAFLTVRESKERADRFADAIACVEYYVEAVRDDLPDAAYILDNLARFVEQLDFISEPKSAEQLEAEAAVEAEPQSLADLVLAEEPVEQVAEAGAPPPAPMVPTAPTVVQADDVDPEIREVFLEEAAEVLQTLQSAMPRWSRDAGDRESLSTMRRAFHTLKGSGRMVGAAQIGEFGWAFEHLLNKTLDGSVTISAPVVTVASEAVELLPGLIEQFRDRQPPSPKLAALVERAQNLAAGRSAEEQAEPDLLAIFREDARERLAEIHHWLGELPREQNEFDVNDDVVRAYHTLRGSGHVVAADALAELAGALEAHLDSIRAATLHLGPEDIRLIEESTQTLAAWVEEVGTSAMEAHDAGSWLTRVDQLSSAVPTDAVQAAEDRQLAEIFAGEALELVQKFEETVIAWTQAPDNRQAPQDLKVVLHTLKGAAYMSNCNPIGNVAKALHARMDECTLGGLVPDAAAFAALTGMAESLYQQLDAYRDGHLRGDGSEVVAQAAAFAWRGAEAPVQPEAVAEPAPAPEPVAETPPSPPVAEEIEMSMPEEVIEESITLTAEPEAILEMVDLPSPEVIEPPIDWGVQAVDAATPEIVLEDVAEPMAAAPPAEAIELVEMPEVAVAAEGEIEMIAMPEPAEPEAIEMPAVADDMPSMAEVVAEAEEAVPAVEEFAAAEVPETLTLDEPAELQFVEVPAVIEQPAPDTFEEVAPEPAAAVPEITEEIVVPEVVETADHEADAELLHVFMAEAEELLESLDHSSNTLESDPHNVAASAELKRVLHTLKGSARMAGLDAIGDVGHELETLFEAVERGQRRADSDFFARLHAASDGLHGALDDLRRGRIPDFQTLLIDLGAEAVNAPVPVDAPAAQPAPFAAEAAGNLRSYDAELGEIFSAEAAELLESLAMALKAWQVDTGNPAPMRELQRVLHTFKGGARMAGLNAMGDLAHDMETRINRIEAGLERADAVTMADLAQEGERLHHMHDLLERGDIAALMGEAEEGELVPTPAPEIDPAISPAHVWEPMLFWRPEEEGDASLRRETARVPVETLDGMLNEAGEISIYRSRLEEHNKGLEAQLEEMSQAIARIRDQLRQMDTETDAQIAARGLGHSTETADRYAAEFDPLEMDRYTRMQELSRALSESIGDLANLHGTMDGLTSEADTLLLQQGRVNTSVQQGLMRTLMVPFSRQVSRLQRVVRQTASENGKQAEAVFAGVESELDRNVLERMTAPLEHLLRNAVVHGIEDPLGRAAAGKEPQGRIAVSLWREGSQLLVELRDDGRGLDFEAIRSQAIKRGLMPPDAQASNDEIAQFIFQPGFSTAKKLTQDAGRGIGMDVVASEVKQLGGSLELTSEWGQGTRFLVRLPLTLAMSQALLVGVGHEQYAMPLSSIEGIARISREQLDDYYREDGPSLHYGDAEYRVRYLGSFIDIARDRTSESRMVNAILVRLGEGLMAGERRIAVVVDQLLGNREVVSKAVGPQISSIAGVTGATILADGRVVLVLDPGALAQDRARRVLITMAAGKAEAAAHGEDTRDLIMVVDDSITIRRVTERLLVKNGYRVVTAKDGLDAMAQLQTENPAAILLDIEMPRADGFEVAAFVRNNSRLSQTPIIMITSRSGDKHRERARSIGVNRYMIKPYQEEQLVSELTDVLKEAAA